MDQPKPLKYTGNRLQQYQELVVQPRLRGDARIAVIARLNKLENKAKIAKKKRDEARELKEEQEAKERSLRIAREFQERLERDKKKREALNAKKRQQRLEAKDANKEYSVALLVSFRCKKQNDKNSFIHRKETTLTAVGKKNIDYVINNYIERQIDRLIKDSKIVSVKVEDKDYVVTEIKREKTDKKSIKMKHAQALNLDGEEVQFWDTGKGRCVYDFLIWRYSNIKGCKKICTDEKLDELFSKYINEKDEEIIVSNPQEDGVCVYQLINFCEAVGCRMYAMDENMNILHLHTPLNINKSASPLMYKVKNNHLYAIMDCKSTAAKYRKTKGESKTNMNYENKETKNKEEVEIVIVETDKPSMEFMLDTMIKEGIEINNKNISFNDSGVASFTLNKKKYIFNEDDSVKNAQKIMKANEKEYSGETTHTLLANLLENNYKQKSICNPHTYKTLVAENTKYRTHYGIVGNHTEEEIRQLVESGDAIPYDIAKCYTACISDPYDNWMFLDFNDEWAPYDGTLKTGLYYIETDDMTLFTGSNIYSNKIIELGIKEGIELTITKQLIPKYIQDKDYYSKLLDEIHTICKGDKDLKKSLINIITGFLGKHKTTKYFPKLTTDPTVVWNDFCSPEYHENETFAYKYENYYIYGYKKNFKKAEINIPHYIQIVDWSNMRLYNMIKKSGGECLFRKTDCAVILNGSLQTGDKIGDYRICELPKKLGMMRPVEERKLDKEIIDCTSWGFVDSINDSDQVEEVFDLLMKTKALLNVSRAGTGKTWNCLEVEKRFMKRMKNPKVIKLAFTNKASMNMGGKTIHKFLKLNKEGKFKLSWLNSLRNNTLLFIIDEISMIGSYLWRRLVELKKYLGNSAYFILCGDYRQAQPVENDSVDYFNSEAVKYLSNNTRIEFVVRKRYDEDLWDFAEDVYERDYTNYDLVKRIHKDDLEFLSKSANICYYNSTRKSLNTRINNYVAKSKQNKINIPYIHNKESEIPENKALQQDVIVYEGLPIMAIKTHSENKSVKCVNNESFVVENIDDDITMSSTRINEEGEEYKHTITCKQEDFHNLFVMKYCSTTHKNQGDTIDKDIVIFDYACMDKNLKYTAITRAKKLSQIHIVY